LGKDWGLISEHHWLVHILSKDHKKPTSYLHRPMTSLSILKWWTQSWSKMNRMKCF